MNARTETTRLYREFLRLRYMFPNKQGRSTLRRWTTMFFSMRQGEYERIINADGEVAASKAAQQWRKSAWKDLDMWKRIAGQSEGKRRKLLDRIITYELK